MEEKISIGLTQRAFSIKRRNGVEMSTSKLTLKNVRIFRCRNVDVDSTLKYSYVFPKLFRSRNFDAISTSNRKCPLGINIIRPIESRKVKILCTSTSYTILAKVTPTTHPSPGPHVLPHKKRSMCKI